MWYAPSVRVDTGAARSLFYTVHHPLRVRRDPMFPWKHIALCAGCSAPKEFRSLAPWYTAKDPDGDWVPKDSPRAPWQCDYCGKWHNVKVRKIYEDLR
jgi:hypothetical protein